MEATEAFSLVEYRVGPELANAPGPRCLLCYKEIVAEQAWRRIWSPAEDGEASYAVNVHTQCLSPNHA